jgi:hypothetical protein
MEKWLVDNARDKRPTHAYSLEEFGFTEAEIQTDFAEYRHRFIEPRESS